MYVVTYDIQSDARRLKASRLLEGYGARVQYSVFECDIDDRRFKRLMSELTKLVELGDGLRAYRIVGEDANVMVFSGRPRVRSERVTII